MGELRHEGARFKVLDDLDFVALANSIYFLGLLGVPTGQVKGRLDRSWESALAEPIRACTHSLYFS